MQKKKRSNKTKRIGILVLCLVGCYMMITLYQQKQEMEWLKQQELSYLQQVEEIQRDIESLQQQLEISNDDEYIEKIARQQLKMIGSEEMLIIDIGQQ
ncbi:FtsB family cell division protein [Clostridium formicaceticum]|nr:septum formation initiator family protein [Clostridium formicaceticum]